MSNSRAARRRVGKHSSDAARPLPRDAVLDLLYYDRVRVASYLSQLEEAGLPTAISEESASDATNTTGYEAGLNTVLHAGGRKEGSESVSTGLSRSYDPAWQLPRLLLRHLENAGAVATAVNGAGVGQFVDISGDVQIITYEILKAMLDSSEFADDWAAGEKSKAAMKLGTGVMRLVPKVVFGRMYSEDPKAPAQPEDVWLNVSDESLLVSPFQILLAHGYELQGVWRMLGIMDALPGKISTPDVLPMRARVGAVDADLDMFDAIKKMQDSMRMILGRRDHQYGVTPVLIYREVGAAVTGTS